MAIDLKKIGDIQTLSLGYTHEATVDASVFSGSLAAFGLSPAKNGTAPKKAPEVKKREETPEPKV